MPGRKCPERQAGPTFAVLLLAGALYLAQARADDLAPQAYDLAIETTMPNLEQALRYATTHEQRCMGSRDLHAAFPLLRHDSLRGCGLEPEKSDGATMSYALVCGSGNVASGAAVWRLDGKRLRGVLDIKFGGKNMTVSQRITARSLGACAPGGGVMPPNPWP